MKTNPQSAEGASSSEVIACSLKMLPEDQWIPASETAIRINPANKAHLHQFRQAFTDSVIPPAHLALLTAKRWPSTGVSLTVSFLEAIDPALATRILSHMNSWSQYCNAKFTQVSANGQVRISLIGSGYWSYLGTDILHIPAGQATMNLQGFSMATAESEYHRVVRHETGHTLGFPHEHTRSEIVNRIDPAKAKAYFLANDGWDANMVTAQVLTPLNDSALIETAHADPNSIMCYWLPASIMKDNIAVAGGTDIDAQDQQFAGMVYPLPHKVIIKEHKDVKLEKVEIKEKNEKIEHKEKVEKVEHKEKLEKVEQKEKNEIIEHKIIDHKVTDILRSYQDVGATSSQVPSGLEQRIQDLEAVVTSLTSFIDSSLRPNLSKGALSNE